MKLLRELTVSRASAAGEHGGGMPGWYSKRYLDFLGSIYIYNEHRGYTAIDRVLEAVKGRWPDDHAFIAAVEKHRVDERKHYLMFRRWFERRGIRPLAIDRTCGHIDRFVQIMFGSRIDDLDPRAMIDRDDLFERLCRVISLTEQRGHRQVEILLRNPIVQSDARLMRIFRIIEQDEPSHWAPYDRWLATHGRRQSRWWERAIDRAIHAELLFVKLPLLFLGWRTKRLEEWPDESDAPPVIGSQEALAA